VVYTELALCPHAAAGPVVRTELPTTSGDALRLATKLAIDSGEYERAAAILELLTSSRTVT
jgi:hypothetical protein